MTEKHKSKEKHDIQPKPLVQKQKRSRFKRVFLLFICVIALCAIIVVASRPVWLDNIINQYSSNSGVATDQIEKANTLKTNKKDRIVDHNNQISLNAEEVIIKFAPVLEEEADLSEEDSDNLSPYDKETESKDKDAAKEPKEVNLTAEDLINNLNDYRIYLANASELLVKFSKDLPYSENLAIIMQVELPKEIEAIVTMCQAYDEMLVKAAPRSEKILLFNMDIFDRFLKIKKETAAGLEMKKLKAKIDAKLDLFSEYIFSPELQELFLD